MHAQAATRGFAPDRQEHPGCVLAFQPLAPFCRPAAPLPAGEKKGGGEAAESESLLGSGPDGGGKVLSANGFRSNSSSDLKSKEFV